MLNSLTIAKEPRDELIHELRERTIDALRQLDKEVLISRVELFYGFQEVKGEYAQADLFAILATTADMYNC